MTRPQPLGLKTATCLLAVLLTVGGLLLWLDKTQAQAGAWVLLLLSVSVGFIHGALDAILLPQRFNSRALAALMFVAYLLAVLVLGWLLSANISWALWALLIMSAWHFGEPYRRWGGRWNGLSAWQSGLTRTVVGGAPVMLPVWLAPDLLASVLYQAVPAIALQGWHGLAWLWLALLVVWLLTCGLGRLRPVHGLRFAWLELLGCAALYAVFSPLMAFALYFGVYHAPVHIWRVWRGWTAQHAQKAQSAPPSTITSTTAMYAVAGTTALSWLLGASLWWLLGAGTATAPDGLETARWLSWLIVAFAALTAPHLVVISLSETFLTKNNRR